MGYPQPPPSLAVLCSSQSVSQALWWGAVELIQFTVMGSKKCSQPFLVVILL